MRSGAGRTVTGITRRGFVVRASASALALELGTHGVGIASTSAAVSPEADSPRLQSIALNVNGERREMRVEPRVTLLDALRDHVGLTGSKKGCDQGTCGACTVLVNGRRVVSCLTLAVMHQRDAITTIEGIGRRGTLHPVQAAFIKHDGFQCGYCTSGQIVSAVGMLSEGHRLDRATIQLQMSGNICRCGCYPHIVDAILDAGARA